LLLSVAIYEKLVLTGSLYLLRLYSYIAFSYVLFHTIKSRKALLNQEKLLSALLAVFITTAIIGWLQYFWLPDLRDLKYLGWDDHLYRLTGSFLDPGFTGLILTFGVLLSVCKYKEYKKLSFLSIAAFLAFTVAFTYSRASYLALAAGLLFLFRGSIKRYVLSAAIVFLLVVVMLPRPEGYGVRLERTHSIIAKAENYTKTSQIIDRYPLFGVGYNNLCAERTLSGEDSETFGKHSCSGVDSSLLFVLATTGIVGLMTFLVFVKTALKNTVGKHKELFVAVVVALAVHSLFLNSIFYAWVMGTLAILYAVAAGAVRGDR
jgi:hypothetical protein